MIEKNEASEFEFSGKIAIVTGGAKGIGRVTALAFSRRGATVVLVDLLEKELGEVRDEIRQMGHHVLTIQGDVSQEKVVTDVVRKTVSNYGKIDILVNNAGVDLGSAPILDMDEKVWDRTLEINLKSVFYFCRNVVPVMRKNGKGAIVNVASLAGKEPNENMAAYAVSKAGMICLSRVLSKEVARENIRVNAIAPVLTATDLLQKLSPEQFDRLLEKIPMGRVGYPEEVAELILFLSSDKSSYITGQCYNISGGRGDY